jgi:hypothetical protein
LNNRCYSQCPYNSYANLDYTAGTPTYKSPSKATVTYSEGLRLKTNTDKVFLNISSNITSLPLDFTFSFWILKADDGRGLMN